MAKIKVYIVEDDAINSAYIKKALQQNGFTVSGIASNGADALSQMAKLQPDIVLMDIVLSGIMDGIETAREIKKIADVPVIYMSAYADQELINRSLDSSSYAFFNKPINVKDLKSNIDLAIYKHSMERKLEAARDEIEYLASLVDSSNDAIISQGLDGKILSWNHGAEKIYGYSRDEIIGKNISRLIPSDRIKEITFINDLIVKGGNVNHYETRRTRKNGEMLYVSLSVSPVLDFSGKIIAISSIARDITSQRELEKEVLDIGMQERLEIGSALHDSLGQLLTGISFMYKSFRKCIPEIKDKKLLDEAEEIQGLINQSIELTRTISKGLVPIDVGGDGFISALNELAEATGRFFKVNVVMDIDEALTPDDSSVSTQLYYIAKEAINNSIRHGKADAIKISLKKNDDKIHLSIIDNGTFRQQDSRNSGLGHKIMNYRAGIIGGVIEKIDNIENGFIVKCILPGRI